MSGVVGGGMNYGGGYDTSSGGKYGGIDNKTFGKMTNTNWSGNDRNYGSSGSGPGVYGGYSEGKSALDKYKKPNEDKNTNKKEK